mmetsp:Transcript_96820/g.273618  ORF Transcript_96820/g.273618 Transcript_96820/m.273618 type:complete len:221 (+) Transcript_96820:73-735(+)
MACIVRLSSASAARRSSCSFSSWERAWRTSSSTLASSDANSAESSSAVKPSVESILENAEKAEALFSARLSWNPKLWSPPRKVIRSSSSCKRFSRYSRCSCSCATAACSFASSVSTSVSSSLSWPLARMLAAHCTSKSAIVCSRFISTPTDSACIMCISSSNSPTRFTYTAVFDLSASSSFLNLSSNTLLRVPCNALHTCVAHNEFSESPSSVSFVSIFK